MTAESLSQRDFRDSRGYRCLTGSIALLMAALCVVVGLQIIGRHVLNAPIAWTEEIARVLMAWIMCAGGIAALRRGQHPRITAFIRRLPESRRLAVERGLRLVLMAFLLALVRPSVRLTMQSAVEVLPTSGLSGAWITAVLPVALLLMAVELARELHADGLAVWRHGTSFMWSAGAAGVIVASVAIPLAVGMTPLAVLVSGFLTTAALGMPLAFTLALTSFSYVIGIGGVGLIILPIRILGAVDSFVLLAIPFFVFGGALMETAGISERIVQLAVAIVGRVRGGLAMVAVVAELIFSGISGSTAADVSAISSLVIPSMRKAGYSGPESVSVVAAASAMGILVPPCLTMVVLGSLVNLSIVTLFLAGFLPALVLAAALLILIAIRARRQGWPVPPPRVSGDLSRAGRRAIVPLGLPVLLFGGIFSGVVTVTEAALIAVAYALVAHAFMGGFKTRDIVDRLAESGIVTATTLWVLAAASAFAWILVREWVPQGLGEWIASVGAGPVAFMLITVAVFVVVGALLEGLPALLIFGPILFPISRTLGLDPVHYGIVIVAAMGIAFFLPPIGVGLSIASGIARVDLDEVTPAYMPYLAALVIGLILISVFPSVTLILPRLLLGYGT